MTWRTPLTWLGWGAAALAVSYGIGLGIYGAIWLVGQSGLLRGVTGGAMLTLVIVIVLVMSMGRRGQ